MASNLSKRLDKLERLVRERLTPPPLGLWMQDPERDRNEFLDELVANRRLAESDRGRVLVIRWWTEAEYEEAERRAQADINWEGISGGQWDDEPPKPKLLTYQPEPKSHEPTEEQLARWKEHERRINPPKLPDLGMI